MNAPAMSLTGRKTRLSTTGGMDRTALERELEALHAQSFAWALVCCGHDRHEAEDMLQNAYVRVLDGRARFAGRSSFRTWLFGVIRRTAAQAQRRRRWRARLRNGRSIDMVADAPLAADLCAERSERAVRLRAALERLPDRQQQVLELVFYHGMTIEESGRIMGITVGTARTHYERGRKALMRRLQSEDPE